MPPTMGRTLARTPPGGGAPVAAAARPAAGRGALGLGGGPGYAASTASSARSQHSGAASSRPSAAASARSQAKPPSARPSERARQQPPSAAPPSARSAASSSASAAAAPSGAAPSARSREAPLPTFHHVRTAKALVEAMHEACEPLKGVDEDWEKRTRAIKTIPLILTQAVEINCFDAVLENLHTPLSAQIADLRSQPVRVACKTLTDLAAEHGRAIAALAVGVLPTLLKNLYVSVKAISAASHDAALKLVAAAPTPGVLSVLVANASDSHKQMRKGCAEYMCAVLESGGLTPTATQVNSVLGALKKLTADADPDVRKAAGKCFWQVHAHFPAPAESFRAKLDPAQTKLLQRLQPK